MTSEERALLDLGTPAAIWIVLLTHRERHYSQQQLADKLGTTRQAIGRALKRLENHNLVISQPTPDRTKSSSRYVYRASDGPMMGGAA